MPSQSKTAHNSGGNSGIANLKPWVKGTSGNPGGRPKNAYSLTAIARRFIAMTPGEIAEEVQHLAARLRQVGKGGKSTMGDLIVVSAMLGLINDPQPGNLRELWRRIDGEVKQPFGLDDGDIDKLIERELARIASARQAKAVGETEDEASKKQ